MYVLRSSHIIKFNDNVCMNTTLHVAPDKSLENSTLDLIIGLDGQEIYEETYPLEHLGKACTDVPGIPIPTKLCAEFMNTNLTTSNFHTCLDLTLEALHKTLTHKTLGCFDIPV